jgi:hypothetical protein
MLRFIYILKGRGSIVSIVTKVWARRSRIQFPAGQEIYLFLKMSAPDLGSIYPPKQRVPRILYMGVKLPDHFILSSTNVKNE